MKQPIPPLWLGLWVPLLAMAWLIPNHYYPWATFHTDAWVAVMLSFAALAVIVRSSEGVDWHGLPVFVAILSLVPFMQFFAGMIPYAGQAWVCTAYLLGFLCALLIGSRWEASTPNMAADGLFLAIGIAAMVSVCLQLRQWLGITFDFDKLEVWAAEFSPGRPSANLGQPNQLATLQIWGVLACAWGICRKKIGITFSIAAALILLFGIVMTQSRMAFLALFVIMCGTWAWRKLWLSPRVPQAVTLLFLYFVVCTFLLQYFSKILGLDVEIRATSLGGASTQLRLKAYSLFLDAVVRNPWSGYGWNRLAVAQLAVAQDHANLTAFFLQSHNLFLDLVLWCGIPIGGAAAFYLSVWIIGSLRRVSNKYDAILIAFILSVGVHAMLELPLHHAYFLLPTGLVMGMLNQSLHNRVLFKINRWAMLLMFLAIFTLLGFIVRDYFRVDASFRAYRLEVARVGNLPPGEIPDVVLLNDLAEFIRYARKDVDSDISDEDLQGLKKITSSFPTPSNMLNLAKALAYRHQTKEAYEWIEKIENVLPRGSFQDLQRIWINLSLTEPAIAAVKWSIPAQHP